MSWSPERYVAALEFAGARHADQRMPRANLPYVVHVVSVATEVIAGLAIEPLPDPDLAIACALLHDTIEDTPTTYADVEAAFGRAIADGVQALSKDPAIPKADQLADSLRRIRTQPREVWIVKLCDRIVNLGAPPPHWTDDKKRRYRAEGYDIAEALGAASSHLDARLRARADGYDRYIG